MGDNDIQWSGATEITEGGTYEDESYNSTTANENALLIDTDEDVELNNPTVTKSGGGSADDNASFYGTNAAVLVMGGTTTSITGGTINTSAAGANGVFSYGGNGGENGAAGDGTEVIISDTTIRTTGDGAGGIMTTGGGTTQANNLTVTTSGRSSAPIRTDRGGGSVTVNGGSYTSSGQGSPAVYSTADIEIEDATLTSNLSEGVCIEGQNSVALTNCTLTANNTARNGNAQFLDGVMIYQSMSGDSSEGTATFSMTGGTFTNKSGHAFHVTNTEAVINLEGVTIENTSGILLSVSDDGWSGASNVATLNANWQELTGDILVGDNSELTLNLSDSSTFTGNISGSITNASGSAISSEVGTVSVTLDDTSKWVLTGDAYISDFSGDAANIIANGFTVYVNNEALDGTTANDDTATTVASGIALSADGSTLTLDEDFEGNTIDLANYPSVTTVDAENAPANNDDGLTIAGNALNNSIAGSSQNVNLLTGSSGNNTLTFGSDLGNFVYYSAAGNDTVTDFASGTFGDIVIIDTTVESVIRSGSNVSITASNGNAIVLQTDSEDELIFYSVDGVNAKSAQIADSTVDAILYSADTDYFALGQEGVLIVSDDADNDIRLDGSEGQEFFNIANIDASNATGDNSLGGDAKANIIIGGSGSNVLWGGEDSADDILFGGGENVFFLGKANGNDFVANASVTDTVNLYNATLSDIVATSDNNGVISVAFNTGNVIAVQSTDTLSATFTLSDGSAYQYNHATQTWQEA